MSTPDATPPITANYGGGVNSSAMLTGMYERGIMPDLIPFADTGKWLDDPGEKPETYRYVELFSRWLEGHGMPAVTVVRHKWDTLYDSCMRNGTLPSKGYGFPGCSVKFKHQIIEAYEREKYGPDQTLVKAIGYHAAEDRGSEISTKGRYLYRYFLKEWGWRQQECVMALKRHGLPVPIKSACHYCPSSKPHEVRWLYRNHPDLYVKAITMEDNAEEYHRQGGGVTKGLGRQWSWRSVIAADEAQLALFAEPPSPPCMCIDDADEDGAAQYVELPDPAQNGGAR